MKTRKEISLKKRVTSLLILLLLIITACDTTETKDAHDSLYVKFINDSTSVTTITSIYVQPMGAASESKTPQGDWSGNVLEANQTIAPGQSVNFTLPIPNLEWSRYRLGILNESGKEIMMDEQPNYPEGDLPITHWGSDERTVNVDIQKSYDGSIYVVRSWSECAGIEN